MWHIEKSYLTGSIALNFLRLFVISSAIFHDTFFNFVSLSSLQIFATCVPYAEIAPKVTSEGLK